MLDNLYIIITIVDNLQYQKSTILFLIISKKR